jgi:hypothetical protein
MRDVAPHQQVQGEPPQRKEHEGAELDDQVQLPARGPVHQVVGAQAHAMQEEDQEDTDIAHQVQVQPAPRAAQIRQQGGQQHRPHHAHQEPVHGSALSHPHWSPCFHLSKKRPLRAV